MQMSARGDPPTLVPLPGMRALGRCPRLVLEDKIPFGSPEVFVYTLERTGEERALLGLRRVWVACVYLRFVELDR